MVGGHKGNEINKTNVPDIRASYRQETLVDELQILAMAAKPNVHHHIDEDSECSSK